MCSWSKLTKKQASHVQFEHFKLSEININPVLKYFFTKESAVFAVLFVCVLVFGFLSIFLLKFLNLELESSCELLNLCSVSSCVK